MNSDDWRTTADTATEPRSNPVAMRPSTPGRAVTRAAEREGEEGPGWRHAPSPEHVRPTTLCNAAPTGDAAAKPATSTHRGQVRPAGSVPRSKDGTLTGAAGHHGRGDDRGDHGRHQQQEGHDAGMLPRRRSRDLVRE